MQPTFDGTPGSPRSRRRCVADQASRHAAADAMEERHGVAGARGAGTEPRARSTIRSRAAEGLVGATFRGARRAARCQRVCHLATTEPAREMARPQRNRWRSACASCKTSRCSRSHTTTCSFASPLPVGPGTAVRAPSRFVLSAISIMALSSLLRAGGGGWRHRPPRGGTVRSQAVATAGATDGAVGIAASSAASSERPLVISQPQNQISATNAGARTIGDAEPS